MSPCFFKPDLSVLTAPPSNFGYAYKSLLRHPRTALKTAWERLRNTDSPEFGGHSGVTRSLVQGLQGLAYPFNYNPSQWKIGSTCIVLSGIDTLQFAINQKRRGNIGRLLAGPNVVTLPDECNSLIAQPEVDLCVVPSEWVKALYLTVCPALGERVLIWAAGVASDVWSPRSNQIETELKGEQVLVYIKGKAGEQLAQTYVPMLSRYFDGVEVIKYGAYLPSEYRGALDRADVMLVLGDTESQGLALAEAWAMGVPTWVHVADKWTAPNGRTYPASAAPYLSSATGAFFQTSADLAHLCGEWARGLLTYSPREYVLKNLRDSHCAEQLLKVAMQP